MGALASLALVTVSLLTPQAAQADVPPGCTVYDANAGYPQNSVYYCAGAAKADALTVANSLAAKANGIKENMKTIRDRATFCLTIGINRTK